MKHEFQRCLYEHTLYIKSNIPGHIFIMCLYMDNLIITSNNLKMIAWLKEMTIS